MVVGVEEDSTAAVAADFTVAARQRFMEVEVSAAESTLRTSVDARTPDIMAATLWRAGLLRGGYHGGYGWGYGWGGRGIGAEDTVTVDGAGEGMASAGRIGDGDMDIRMTTVTARGITRPGSLLLVPVSTLLRAIPRAIRILTTGATILRRQIPTHGRCPTRTDRQDPGDLRYREERPIRTTQTAISRRLRLVGQFSLSTG